MTGSSMRSGAFHRAAAAIATLVLATTGCADPPQGPGSVTVVHWWTSGGESEAMTALKQLFLERHPNYEWVDGGVSGTSKARETITEQMLGGHPPGTFQANGGWDLLQWVLYNNRNTDQNKMDDLDDLAARQQWDSQFPSQVLQAVRFDSHTYGVPLNIHRVNTLFFNKSLFDEQGLSPPRTLDELFTVAAELRARGITPIALGSNDPWPLGILLFENLLVSRGGGFYRQFFRGDVDALDEKMRGVVEDLGRLLSYTNLNAPLLTWTDAADLVRERKAAMTIMGDWTKAYFESKRGMPDVDFGSVPMPGTADTFVFTTDTFGLPLGSPDRQAALDLLELFGSAEGQNLFNPIKGSISPRKDADTSVYKDPMAQRTIADFQLAAMNPEMLVPATAIVTPPAYLHAIRPVLAQFAIDGNISVVLHALNNYADILQSSPLRDLL